MAKIHIHAGDFEKGKGRIDFPYGKNPRLIPPLAPGKFSWTGYGKPVVVRLTDIEATDTGASTHIGKALAWGIAGDVAMGPVGALVGTVIGGYQTNVTFTAKFQDGSRMLATTDLKTYERLTALLP